MKKEQISQPGPETGPGVSHFGVKIIQVVLSRSVAANPRINSEQDAPQT
jgi:hypothetical protein